jgi:hypothetical protein
VTLKVSKRPVDAGAAGLEEQGSCPVSHSLSKSHADDQESDVVRRKTFAAQIARSAIGVLRYAVAGLLGCFVGLAYSVAIFVFMVRYYATTSCCIRTAQSHATQRRNRP